jgi:hypothetical protein
MGIWRGDHLKADLVPHKQSAIGMITDREIRFGQAGEWGKRGEDESGGGRRDGGFGQGRPHRWGEHALCGRGDRVRARGFPGRGEKLAGQEEGNQNE